MEIKPVTVHVPPTTVGGIVKSSQGLDGVKFCADCCMRRIAILGRGTSERPAIYGMDR